MLRYHRTISDASAKGIPLSNSDKKPSVIKAAMAMSTGTLASRILGYVRDALLLSLFNRTVTDAFVVAFSIPNLIRRVFGEGSLSVSFIPIYMEQLHADQKDQGQRAQQLANSVYTLLTSLTMTIAALAWVFMGPLLDLWVGNKEGYAAIPGKMELTVELARIMTLYVFLVTTYAFWMAMANARGKFFWPAMGPALFNFTVIIFSLFPQSILKVPGAFLAWGVVVGGIAQAATVGVQLYREGCLPRLRLQIHAPGLAAIARNLGPGIFGLGVFQIMTIANRFFAARLPEGTQSYVYAADRILELPQSLIAISLGTALLPVFSRQLNENRLDDLLRTAHDSLKWIIFLAVPASVGMFFLAQPIVEVLFVRGAFTAQDGVVTAQVISAYAFLLLASSLAKIAAPGFYALKNPWVPAKIAAGVLLVHLFIADFLVTEHGIVGLAVATGVSSFINMIGLQIAFRYYLGAVGVLALLGYFLRLTPAFAGLAAVCYGFYHLPFEMTWRETLVGKGFYLGLTIIVAGIVYLLLAHLVRCPETRRFFQLFQRLLKRRQS